jgi:hypothetical protein
MPSPVVLTRFSAVVAAAPEKKRQGGIGVDGADIMANDRPRIVSIMGRLQETLFDRRLLFQWTRVTQACPRKKPARIESGSVQDPLEVDTPPDPVPVSSRRVPPSAA